MNKYIKRLSSFLQIALFILLMLVFQKYFSNEYTRIIVRESIFISVFYLLVLNTIFFVYQYITQNKKVLNSLFFMLVICASLFIYFSQLRYDGGINIEHEFYYKLFLLINSMNVIVYMFSLIYKLLGCSHEKKY